LVFLKKTIVLTAFFLRGLRAAYFWEETMKKLILASAAALAFGAIAHAEGELVIRPMLPTQRLRLLLKKL